MFVSPQVDLWITAGLINSAGALIIQPEEAFIDSGKSAVLSLSVTARPNEAL